MSTPTDPTAELAREIEALSNGVKKLLAGRLTERAVVTLIYDAMPPGPYGGGKLANRSQIKEVLNSASRLTDLYIKKSKRNGGSNDAQ